MSIRLEDDRPRPRRRRRRPTEPRWPAAAKDLVLDLRDRIVDRVPAAPEALGPSTEAPSATEPTDPSLISHLHQIC